MLNIRLAQHTDGGGKRDPVRFARNASLVSGLPAAVSIVFGITEDNLALAILPSLTLLCAVTGVTIWSRKERQRQGREGASKDEYDRTA